MPRPSRRLRLRATALACSSLTIAGVGLAGAATVQAASDSFSCQLSGGEACRAGDRHSLTSVSSYSGSSSVASGAAGSQTGSPSSTYGKWYTGTPSACRVFGGSTLLYLLLKNVDGGYRTIFGSDTYGSGSSGC